MSDKADQIYFRTKGEVEDELTGKVVKVTRYWVGIFPKDSLKEVLIPRERVIMVVLQKRKMSASSEDKHYNSLPAWVNPQG
jgi:hypothetical protein